MENIITVISKYSLKQCLKYANVFTKNTRNQYYQYLKKKQKNGADNQLFPFTENIPTEFQMFKKCIFQRNAQNLFQNIFFSM